MIKNNKRVVGAIACVVWFICSVHAGAEGERDGSTPERANGVETNDTVKESWEDRCTLTVYLYSEIETEQGRNARVYLSGMPVVLELRLERAQSIGTSEENIATEAPPEKWYKSVEFDVREISGDKSRVLKPVLMQEFWPSDNRADGKVKRSAYWVIPWQDTVGAQGYYRVQAKWQGVVLSKEGHPNIQFRDLVSTQDRADMYLARASADLRYIGDAESAMAHVQSAVKTAGGHVFCQRYYTSGWDSGILLGRVLRDLERYSEAVAACEELLRVNQYQPTMITERSGSITGMIATIRIEEAVAKAQLATLPVKMTAAWKGKKAGDVETLDLGDGVLLKMVWCPPGSYMRGSPDGEAGRMDDESQHEVTITKGFWIAQSEVTVQQWLRVMGSTSEPDWTYWGFPRPKTQVTWKDCQKFINRLNARVPDGRFRLPTEAEWEYACRAGTATAFHGGDSLGVTAAKFYGSNPSTNEFAGRSDRIGGLMVQSCQPNAWGLYDMHGNVWEWCQDWYGPYPTGSVTDPVGPASGTVRVNRGGGYYSSAEDCRSARRHGDTPSFRSVSLGFRLVVSER